MTVNPFPLVEKAVKELVEAKYPAAVGKVGGDLSYTPDQDFYVWIGLIPGGQTTEVDGTWIVDLDVFSTSYSDAMTRALAIEALLIGPRHVTATMRLDNCYQNAAPSDRPWDDDTVYRVGATYVFTARRT